jgi:hypothetical protein
MSQDGQDEIPLKRSCCEACQPVPPRQFILNTLPNLPPDHYFAVNAKLFFKIPDDLVDEGELVVQSQCYSPDHSNWTRLEFLSIAAEFPQRKKKSLLCLTVKQGDDVHVLPFKWRGGPRSVGTLTFDLPAHRRRILGLLQNASAPPKSHVVTLEDLNREVRDRLHNFYVSGEFLVFRAEPWPTQQLPLLAQPMDVARPVSPDGDKQPQKRRNEAVSQWSNKTIPKKPRLSLVSIGEIQVDEIKVEEQNKETTPPILSTPSPPQNPNIVRPNPPMQRGGFMWYPFPIGGNKPFPFPLQPTFLAMQSNAWQLPRRMARMGRLRLVQK